MTHCNEHLRVMLFSQKSILCDCSIYGAMFLVLVFFGGRRVQGQKADIRDTEMSGIGVHDMVCGQDEQG